MNRSYLLTDSSKDLATQGWRITQEEFPGLSDRPWSITQRVLQGGRQTGVEVIEIDNGRLSFVIVPTRGLNILRAEVDGIRLGWNSPVCEVVHPQYVRLSERNGKGWLDGYNELVCRCGLESIGAPCVDGAEILTLHGRISNLPASWVEIGVEMEPAPRLVVRGRVDESLMFGPHLRLETEITTGFNSPFFTLNDQITNLLGKPQEMQYLYHVNFGAPLVAAGAAFLAPVIKVAPRDRRAAECKMADWHLYEGEHGGDYTEQVYFAELAADSQGNTKTMIRSADESQAAIVEFNIQQLPYLSLWKNESLAEAGYATGIEPATSYPLPRWMEREAGRVPVLQPNENRRFSVTIGGLTGKEEVRQAATEIARIRTAAPTISEHPVDQRP